MVTILDAADLKKLRNKIDRTTPLGIAFLAGAEAERHDPDYDLAVISPGIDPATPPERKSWPKRGSVAIIPATAAVCR